MRDPAASLEPRQSMRLHVRALFRCDDEGRLVAVNEADGGPAPRFFLGRTADGVQCWFRDDLESSLAYELAALAESLPATLPLEEGRALAAPSVRVLEKSEPVTRVRTGAAGGPVSDGIERAESCSPAFMSGGSPARSMVASRGIPRSTSSGMSTRCASIPRTRKR